MDLNYDAHVHFAMPEKELSDDEIHSRLKAYADSGVTFLRDGGDKASVSLRAKEIAGEYGIDYRTPAFAVYEEGHYGAFLGLGFKDIDEYKALLKKASDEGADFIKIMASGIMDFSAYGVLLDGKSRAFVVENEEVDISIEHDEAHEHGDHEHGAHDHNHGYITSLYKKDGETGGLNEDLLAEMVELAHAEGFSVMAHVNGAANIKSALRAEVDSIEHGYYMDDECIDMLASSDTVWVPTIVPVANLIGKNELGFDDTVIKKIIANQAKNIQKVTSIGGMIALGTDAGAVCVDHAFAVKSEYNFLKAAMSDRDGDAHLSLGLEQIKWRFKR